MAAPWSEHRCFGAVVTVLLALLVLPRAVEAATKTWTGSGVDPNWSTPANWSPPGAVMPGDDLVFPASPSQFGSLNDTAAGTSYNSIGFTGPAAGYVVLGNAIQLAAGISADIDNLPNEIRLAITLGASQTWSVTGVSLVLSGAVDLGVHTLTLATTSTGVFNIAGGIAGSGGLTTAGPGGAVGIGVTPCSYTGPTNIAGSYLSVSGGSLSPTSVVTVGSGATLALREGGSVGPVTVNPGGFLVLAGGPTSPFGSVTDLTMQPGSSAIVDLWSATDYGQLNVSGTATLNGPFLFISPLYFPAEGTTFTVINKISPGAVTGSFDGKPEGTLFLSIRLFLISYVSGDGNDVVVTDRGDAAPPVVPTLGGAGLAALGALLALAAAFVLRRSHLSSIAPARTS